MREWEAMLELHDIHIRYPEPSGALRTVVDRVSVSVAPGEHVVLLGANGSGKSSLIRSALGLNALAGGTVSVDGLNPYLATEAIGARSLLGYVGQRPDNQIVATSVEDEVAFGPENLGVARTELRARVDAAIATVGLTGMERREPHTLSGGQKQRLAMAGALAMRPRYLLLDEPMSMLDEPTRVAMAALITELVSGGMGALHITHDLADAAEADRVIVLAGGSIVYQGTPAGLLAHASELDSWGLAAGIAPIKRPAPTVVAGQAGIVLDHVSATYEIGFHEVAHALIQANFSVSPGEIVVVKGPTGAGKSTLLKVCAGLMATAGGVATIGGEALTAAAARGHVGLTFQDPESALFADTVVDDVAFAPRNFGASAEGAAATARRTLERVGLNPERFGQRSPFTLSGGEARLAAIAGVLAYEPSYILADEPTSALDARGRLAVREILIAESARAGVVIVTHTPGEFESVADRVYTLAGGVLAQEASE